MSRRGRNGGATARLVIRLTPGQLEEVHRRAAAAGEPLYRWALGRLLPGAEVPVEPAKGRPRKCPLCHGAMVPVPGGAVCPTCSDAGRPRRREGGGG